MPDGPRRLFIVGTDTGVGKTVVSCGICELLRAEGRTVGAYKPAVSGARIGPDGAAIWEDVEQLWQATGRVSRRNWIAPQRFRAPLAPNEAARLEGAIVDEELLRSGAALWRGQVDALVIEGAGGLLSPLGDRTLVADLAVDLRAPLVLVARLQLGTINHTLLTVEAAHRRGLTVAAIVLNATSAEEADSLAAQTNPAAIQRYYPQIPVVVTPWNAAVDLRQAPAFRTINWYSLMLKDDGPDSPIEFLDP